MSGNIMRSKTSWKAKDVYHIKHRKYFYDIYTLLTVQEHMCLWIRIKQEVEYGIEGILSFLCIFYI